MTAVNVALGRISPLVIHLPAVKFTRLAAHDYSLVRRSLRWLAGSTRTGLRRTLALRRGVQSETATLGSRNFTTAFLRKIAALHRHVRFLKSLLEVFTVTLCNIWWDVGDLNPHYKGKSLVFCLSNFTTHGEFMVVNCTQCLVSCNKKKSDLKRFKNV